MISAQTNPWAAGWIDGHAPPKDQTVAEWCAENVPLANSPIGAKYQPGGYSDAILDDLIDPNVYESATVGHTGMGKSAILECATCYAIAQQPGPMLQLGQTDDTVKEWVKSRLTKAMNGCSPVERLIPKGIDRHLNQTFSVIFPHMEMFLGGANLTNTQEKSMRYVFGDEVWRWDKGLIIEALARHHDRWNRKSLLLAQGGEEGDDWHEFTSNGLGYDRGFCCPKCNRVQIDKWSQVKFDEIRDKADNWEWPSIFETIRYECENEECDEIFKDTPRDRKRRVETAVYVCRDNPSIPGRVTRYIPAMSNSRIPFSSLVQKWLLAQDALKVGNKDPLRQFIQKVLAQFWVVKPEVPELRVDEDGYRASEFAPANGTIPRWDKEQFRILTIDVQKNHFWGRIRAWSIDGSSRGLYEGKITAWENIRALQDRYGIPNRLVFIDSRYRPDEVAKWRQKLRGDDQQFLWNMIMGEDSKGYSVEINKRRMLRPFSNLIRASSQSGISYSFFKFSNLRAKDMLKSLMDGNGAYFGIEADHSKEYAKQMQSEHKQLFGKEWRWVPIKDHFPNHFWDTEVMQIVAACVLKCLGGLVEED